MTTDEARGAYLRGMLHMAALEVAKGLAEDGFATDVQLEADSPFGSIDVLMGGHDAGSTRCRITVTVEDLS